MGKVKYNVIVKYNVYDFVEVELDESTNPSDALAIAEEISCDRNLDEMCVDIEYVEFQE